MTDDRPPGEPVDPVDPADEGTRVVERETYVERDIQAAWPGIVLDVRYEPAEDFVTIVIADGTDQETAVALSCETVVPVMHSAGSRALFAIYAASGDIVSSWNRCSLTPPPSPAAGG